MGEQGRGFAVVAGEVRSLAQRSATAAKEIGGLISDSVRQVDEGMQLVHAAGGSIGEISTSAREQTTCLSQVSEAVSQFDQMTQQNAALAQESPAAAQALRVQAQQLAGLVEAFRLPSGNAPPR